MHRCTKILMAMIFIMIPCIMQTSPSKAALYLTIRSISSDDRYKSTLTKMQMYAQSAQNLITATTREILRSTTSARKDSQKNTPHLTITPDQARKKIEETMLAAYEGKIPFAPEKIITHVNDYSQYLDPEKDKAQKEAINFAFKNSDKFSIFYLSFWWEAWDGTKILRSLPIPEKIRKTPCSEMIPRLIYLSTQTK